MQHDPNQETTSTAIEDLDPTTSLEDQALDEFDWQADGLDWRSDGADTMSGAAIDGVFSDGWGRRNLGEQYASASIPVEVFDRWVGRYCLNPEVDLGIHFTSGVGELFAFSSTLDEWVAEASGHPNFKGLELDALDSSLLTRYLPAFSFPERQPLVFHKFHLWDLLWFLKRKPALLTVLKKPCRLRPSDRLTL
jgi:hypothetical protein